MRRSSLLLFLIIIFSLSGFSFIYINGNNIIKKGEKIQISGYDEKQVLLTVYKVSYPLDVILYQQSLPEIEKSYLYSKTLKADKEGNINNTIEFEELGLYYLEFQSIDSKKNYYEEVLVTETNFIATYDGDEFFIKIYNTNTLDDVKSRIILQDTNGKTEIYNNISELKTNFSSLKRVVVENDSGIQFQNFYSKSKIYKDSPLQIITDRPLYKPNQTINFRVISYQQDNNKYIFKNDNIINVNILDPSGNQILSQTYKTDNFGGANGQYYLSESAPLGYYSIQLTSQDGESYYNGFYVQDYVKPEYFVEISTDEDTYYTNDLINFSIKLTYLNGNPVKNANISLYVYYDNLYGYEGRSLLYQTVTFTDENGILNIPIKVQDGHEGYYTLETIIVDESQRQIQETHQVRIMDGSYLIELDNRYVQAKPNETVTFNGTITDRQGSLAEGNLKIDLYKQVWDEEAWKTINILENTFYIPIKNGILSFEYSFSEEASYFANLFFEDSSTSFNVYISPYARTTHAYFSHFEIKDRLIRFSIDSDINSTGLIFLAGREIYDFVEYSSSKNEYIFEIPDNLLERNIFIHAILFNKEGKEVLQKSIDLGKLEKLSFSYVINTDKETYAPKDDVSIQIEAEEEGVFTLSVVDEGIYLLVEDRKDILNELYPKLYYVEPLITTGTSYIYIPKNLYGLTLEESDVFTSYKGSDELSVNTREYFPDTALWIPFIETKNRKAEIVFTNPDSLTTWRITSYGFTKDGEKINKTTTTYKSNLDFYVRPLLPNFAVIGDKANFYLVIYNNTDETRNIKYKIDTDETISITPKNGELTLLPNSQTTLRLNLEALKIGESTITFDFGHDIVKLPFSVKSDEIWEDVIKLVDTTNGYTIKKGEFYRPFNLDTLMIDSLNYLRNYSYKCSEQVVSVIVPLLTATKKGYIIEDLDQKVTETLQILYKYQKDDGGWGWWGTSEESHPEISAYVMYGLKKIEDEGYYVSQATLSNGLSYMKKHVSSGFVYHVLNLYGIESEFTPKNILDELYYSFYHREYLDNIIPKINEKEDIAFIDFFDDNYFYSITDANAVLLDLLLQENEYFSTSLKVFKFLLSSKKGYTWYSTKEISKILDIILRHQEFFSVDMSNLKYENNDFIIAQNDIFLYNQGLYEINTQNLLEPSTTENGIILNKILYKKNNVQAEKEENRYIIDAFLEIDESQIPSNIYFKSETNILERDNELTWYNVYQTQIIYQENNLQIKYDNRTNRLYINELFVENPRMLIKNSKFIYIIKDERLFEYEICTNNFKEYTILNNTRIKSMALLNNKPILLVENINTNKDYLYIEDKYESLSMNVQDIDVYQNNIILFSDRMYLWDNSSKTTKSLFPISGNKLINMSQSSVEIFGNVKFKGNSKYVGPLGLYKIDFINNNEKYFKEGDVVKVVISMQSDIPQFLVTEDYLPGNVQILENYSEKNISQSSKFYYSWYSPWNYWYSAREIRKDKIAFFSSGYKNGQYSYYMRLLNSGEYNVLPAVSFTMYWQETYGTSESIVLDVK